MGSKQFLTLVDGTGDAAFAVDATGSITAWNSAAAELFGLTEAEAISLSCHQLLQASDEKGMVCSEQCVIQAAVRDNQPLANFDLRVQTKAGKQWCNLSILIVSDPASGSRHAIHIVRPREMRKRLEQAFSEFVRIQTLKELEIAPTVSSPPTPVVNVRLTSREIEVLKSLAKGHSTRAIANELNISSATVNNHIKHILTKLEVHTRLEAIRYAERMAVI